MARNFNKLRADLDDRLDQLPDGQGDQIRQEIAERLNAELAAHEHGLADVRKARRLTQAQMGALMGVTQAQVSRIEHQADLYLSTLRSYIEAMGGEVQIMGVFAGPDGQPVRVPLAIEELVPPAESDPAGEDLMAGLERAVAAAGAGSAREALAKAAMGPSEALSAAMNPSRAVRDALRGVQGGPIRGVVKDDGGLRSVAKGRSGGTSSQRGAKKAAAHTLSGKKRSKSRAATTRARKK